MPKQAVNGLKSCEQSASYQPLSIKEPSERSLSMIAGVGPVLFIRGLGTLGLLGKIKTPSSGGVE